MHKLSIPGAVAILLTFSIALAPRALAQSEIDPASVAGGAASDTVEGSFPSAEADYFTGTMTASVEVQVPPGRPNLTPDVKLSYMSDGGPSMFGYGWSLPLGRIERTTKDGVPGCAMNFDKFSLSLPGASVELVPVGTNLFRARLDESFIDVAAFPGANRWEVRSRNGVIYRFGIDSTSRVSTGSDEFFDTSNGCEFTSVWALNEIEDANGNLVEITYEKIENILYPSEVLYGGHQTAFGGYHPFRIEFVRSPTPLTTPVSSYRRGALERLTYLIDRIAVYAKESHFGDYSLVRAYDFEYQEVPESGRMLLTGVQRTLLPPLSFEYSPSAFKHTELGVAAPIPGGAIQRGQVFYSSANAHTFRSLIDMDGDGFVDELTGLTSNWSIRKGVPGGFAATEIIAKPTPGASEIRRSGPGNNPERDIVLRDTFDINGDGIPDFVDANLDNWVVVPGRIEESTGAFSWGPSETWTGAGRWLSSTCRDYPSEGQLRDQTVRGLLDVNGDGRPDIVDASTGNGCALTSWRVFLNTGCEDGQPCFVEDHQFVGSGPIHASLSLKDNNAAATSVTVLNYFDFNGDGLPDRVTTTDHEDPGIRFDGVELDSNGSPGDVIAHGMFLCDQRGRPWLCDDYHNDPVAGVIKVYLNSGDSFAPLPMIQPAKPTSIQPNGQGASHRYDVLGIRVERIVPHFPKDTIQDFVDLNGDGYPDRIRIRANLKISPHADDASAPISSMAWEVQLNRGGSLESLVPSAAPDPIAPLYGTANERVWPGLVGLGRHRAFSNDGSGEFWQRSDFIDWDGDGFLDRVDVYPYGEGHDAGQTWRIDVARPDEEDARMMPGSLLVRAHNGFGGVTDVEYSPSTLTGGGPGLPFVKWVVTATRTTDGLCDVPTGADPFDPAENPCIPAGHEIHRTLEYEGGRFDPVDREFQGFERVVSTDIDGNQRERRFAQDKERRGKLLEETVFAGETVVSVRDLSWGVVADGDRSQVYLEESCEWSPGEVAAEDHCVMTRNDPPDLYGRIDRTQTLPCTRPSAAASCSVTAGPGAVTTHTEWTDAGGGAFVRDRPRSVKMEYIDSTATLRTLTEKWFFYDGDPNDVPATTVTKGNLTAIKSRADAAGNVVWTRFGVDAFGNKISTTDGREHTSYSDFSEGLFSLYPWRERSPSVDGVQLATQTIYSLAYGKPISVVDHNGSTTTLRYDALGRLICVAKPGDSCGTSPITDSCNQAALPSASVRYRYCRPLDPAGSFQDRLSFVEVRSREPNYIVGYLTSRQYSDALGRQRLSTDESVVGGGSLKTVVRDQADFDSAGRPSQLYSPYIRPPGGIPQLPGLPARATSFDYHLNGGTVKDPLGRPHVKTETDGRATKYFYHGRVQETEDARGMVVRTWRNHLGHETKEERTASGVAPVYFDRTFDGLGRLLRVVTSGVAATEIEYGYDFLGRLQFKNDPDSGTWVYQYDANGNLIFEHLLNDSLLHYAYDELNRIRARCASSPCVRGASAESSYFYDDSATFGLGRLHSVEDQSGSESFVYDARGRIVSQTKTVETVSTTMGFSYDEADHLKQVVYPDGEIVQYTYDTGGRVLSVDSIAPSPFNYALGVRYDILGRQSEARLGSGALETWSWHDASESHRLQALEVRRPDSSKLLDLEYFYDDGGKIDEIVDHRFGAPSQRSNGVEYGYDGMGRLLTAEYASGASDVFTHSTIGNLASKNGSPMVYDPVRPHQLESWGGRNYTHESHGGVASRTLFVGGDPQEFEYDSFRRLSHMSRPASGGGVETVSFGYDYADRRVSRVRDGNTEIFFHRYLEARDGLLVKYYYLGDRLIASNRVVFAQASGSGAPLSLPPWTAAGLVASCGLVMVLILWAPGRREVRIGVVVARSRAAATTTLLVLFPAVPVLLAPQCGGGSSTRHFYHLDHLGSTQLVTLASGGVHEEIRYRAWGEIRGRWDGLGAPIAASEDSRFEWNGYETEHGWELEYAGARFYDSGIGQFLSHDPEGQYASPYAYGPGDPANGTDPSGAFFGSLSQVFVGLLGIFSGSATYAGGSGGSVADASVSGGGPGEGGVSGGSAMNDSAPGLAGASVPKESYGTATVAAEGTAKRGLKNEGAGAAGGAHAAGEDVADAANGFQGKLQGSEYPYDFVGPLTPVDTRSVFASDDRVQGINPVFKSKLGEVLTDLRAQGYQPRVAEGLRTVEEQRAKISQGFSPPGTDDPGSPRASRHLTGRAADVIDRRWGWSTPGGKEHPFWTDLGSAATARDLIWGGRWRDRDVAHIEGR